MQIILRNFLQQWFLTIFEASAGQNRRILSTSLIHNLAQSFSTVENITACFTALSPEAQYLCALTYLFGARGIPCINEQFVAARLSTENEFSVQDDELVQSFLVYAAGDEDGTVRYAPFADLEPLLRNLCSHVLAETSCVPIERSATSLSRQLAANDLTTITTLATYNKLKITKADTLNKNSELLLTKLLHSTQPPYHNSGKNHTLLTLSVDYARHIGMLVPDQDMLYSNNAVFHQWLMDSLTEKTDHFIEFIRDVYPVWNTELLATLLTVSEPQGIAIGTFPEYLRNEADTMVKLLAYLGIVHFYKKGAHCVMCPPAQMENKPEVAKTALRCIIMPDFTALLPQEIESEQLYWFSRVGEILSLDHVYKGTISKDVVNNSLSCGIDKLHILSWLQNQNCPPNVLETVREWIREFSRLSFETASVIICSEEKITRQLVSYAPLSHAIEPVNAHAVFKVRKGFEKEVETILTSLGFDIRPGDGRSDSTLHNQDKPVNYKAASPFTVSPYSLTPIVTFSPPEKTVPVQVKQGKYSSELKALAGSDLLHVVDYALLMGQILHFEYAGSQGVNKGIYMIHPHNCKKGADPVLTGESVTTHKPKSFLLSKIVTIGVKPDND